MQALWPLGNDIVDLKLAGNKKSAADSRYVERVLAPEERHALLHDTDFWACWSAKEAAYKALRKTDPGLVFAHRRFLVHPETPLRPTAGPATARGTVRYDAHRIPVRWNWNDDWVHCLTGGEPSDYRVCALSECRRSDSFTALKTATGLSDESVAARWLALSLLAERGLDHARIVREPGGRRPGPPRIVLADAAQTCVDLSLSHDGRFAAAAIRIGDGVP